jgi:hypothetical protein
MKPVVTAFFLAALFQGAANAQAPWNPRAPENAQLRPAFSPSNVEEVLAAIGARHQRGGTPARPLIVVTFANNRRAVISFVSCNADASACRALGIQSSWVAPAGASGARAATAIEQFNRRYSFSKAFVAGNGRLTLQRYLTGDYGYIRGDLAVNLLVFANQADRFANEVVQRISAGR